MISRNLTIFIFMGIVKAFNRIHNFHAKRSGFLGMSETKISLSFFLQKNIYRFRKTHQAEHSGKSLSLNEAFLRKEVVFKESRLFHHESNALIHIARHDIHHMRKHIFQIILCILRLLRNITENQTAKSIGTSSIGKAVIAGSNHILSAKFLREHLMVRKARFCTGKRRLNAEKSKVVRSNPLLVLHREIRDCILGLLHCF